MGAKSIVMYIILGIFLFFSFQTVYPKDKELPQGIRIVEPKILETLAVVDQYNKGNFTLIKSNINMGSYYYPKHFTQDQDVVVYSKKYPQGCIVHMPMMTSTYYETLSYIPINRTEGPSLNWRRDFIFVSLEEVSNKKENDLSSRHNFIVVSYNTDEILIPERCIPNIAVQKYLNIATNTLKKPEVSDGNYFNQSLEQLNKTFSCDGGDGFLCPEDPDSFK